MLVSMIRPSLKRASTATGQVGLLMRVLVCAALLPVLAGSEPTSSDDRLVPVTTPAGLTILAALADTTEKRARGLMFRESLPKDRGMLVTFPDPQHWTSWAKSTSI